MENIKNNNKTNRLKKFLPIMVLAAGAGAFIAMGGGKFLSFEAIAENRDALKGWADANRVLAVAAYMGAYALVVALSLPGAVWMSLGGAFIFGVVVNSVAAVISATVGATIIFLAARYAFADMARARAGAMVKKLESGFNKNAFSYLLFLRLVPLFPFWLVNLVPALLGVRTTTYIAATLIGIIPGAVVFSGVGAGLGHLFETGARPDLGIIFEPQIFLPLLGLAALSLVPVLYGVYRSKKETPTASN